MNDNPPNNARRRWTSNSWRTSTASWTPESSRRIEALLASDPEVRRRLQALERTWDLLDELDAAPVGEPFTQTTLEMVAVAARQDVGTRARPRPRGAAGGGCWRSA